MHLSRAVTVFLLTSLPVAAGVIYEDDFETLNEEVWSRNIKGEATIEVVDGGIDGKCLQITSNGGRAYLTMQLDPELYQGVTLVMTGMVKLQDVRQGEQTYATPKFHFAQKTAADSKTLVHAAERWVGTFDWTEKKLQVDVRDDCVYLVMDIGNQNGYGTFWVDNFKLEDTLGQGRPVSLLPVANTSRSDGVAGDGQGGFVDLGPLDLYQLPEGNLETEAVTFYLPRPGDNGGAVALRLQGAERPDYPAETEPVTVNAKVGRLAFLHTAAWADPAAQQTIYSVEVRYADGATETIPMRAGADLGNFDDPRPLPNWTPAWTGPSAAGRTVGCGASFWDNPRPGEPIESIKFVSGGNAVPVILAVTYTTPRKEPKG